MTAHMVSISNTIFQNPEEKREGNQEDEDNLSKTFQYLGYTVVIYQDCDSKEMVDVLNTIAQSTAELEGHDSFVCCILSHGKEGEIVAVDGKCVKLENITSPIKECKALNGKPKMFFIQACRGTMSDKGIVCDGDCEDLMLKIPFSAMLLQEATQPSAIGLTVHIISRHFVKLSAKMQSMRVWCRCTP